MNEIKYLIKGELVETRNEVAPNPKGESKEAMEWMKANEGVFVECNNGKRFVYKEGYFRRYIFRDIYYYKSLPRSEIELSITNWCSDKQWCPVQ